MLRALVASTLVTALLAGTAFSQNAPHFRMGPSSLSASAPETPPATPDPSIAFINAPVTNEPIVLGAAPGTPYIFDFKDMVTVAGGSVGDAAWSLSPDGGTAFYEDFDASAGVLTGTPPFGSHGFTIVATLPSGATTSQPFVLAVANSTITFQGSAGQSTPLAVPAAAGQPYSIDFSSYLITTGGVQKGNLTWSIAPVGGSTGFFSSFSTEGVLQGTPGVGTYQFNLTAHDPVTGASRQQLFELSVNGVPLIVSSITRSNQQTCGISASGGAMCWGNNISGYHLGDTGQNVHTTAVPITGLESGVASISGGSGHLCALRASGALSCWGQGFLGDGPYSSRNTPVPVAFPGYSLNSVTTFDTGNGHVCAVLEDGTVWCWGSNTEGQLSGSLSSDGFPFQVSGLPAPAVAVASGGSHSCALLDNATAWCWGNNAAGQLGANRPMGLSQRSLVPVQVVGVPEGISEISAYEHHTCIRTTAGAAKCFGLNNNGQIGDDSLSNRNIPTQVLGLGAGVARISAGHALSCAITTAGEARCWGGTQQGSVGNGVTTSTSVRKPVTVTGMGSGVSWISASYLGACATMTDGTSRCWGRGGFGQNGDGMQVNRGTPVLVIQ